MIQIVRREMLEQLAAELPREPTKPISNGHHAGNGQVFDVDVFISRNGFDLAGPDPYQGGRKWTFNQSPLCEHHGDGPFLIQFSTGALSAGCHHESCSWNWQDLRAKFERKGPPGMADLRPAEYRDPPAPEPILIEPGKPFPIDALPGSVADYVGGAASAIGCDPSYVALPLLGALARAIGNKRVIRLKQSWTEPAVIWAAIIGKSGTHKTPALVASMRFLERKQSESIAGHVEALTNYEQEMAVYDRDYTAWKRTKNTTEPPPWAPVEPMCERYVTTDTTIEALAAMLAGQFDGLLVTRDELAGWLGGMAEYKGGKGSDLGHWLACWSGVPLTVDRKTGAVKMLHIPRAAVSIVGGIQPGVLRTAIGREHMEDGLCARLLMAMPEPRQVKWTEAIVDPSVEAAMQNVFDRLLSLEAAADSDGRSIPYPLVLLPAAKSVWVQHYDRHREELVRLDEDLTAAWSKLEAYTARFALIFQLCKWATGAGDGDVVDKRSMEAAIQLSDWFGGEAKRVYELFGECAEDREQRELVEMIQRRGGSITIRELTHSGRRYRRAGQAEAALGSLVKAGWGTWQVEPTPGRPRTTFKLHSGNSGNGNTSQ